MFNTTLMWLRMTVLTLVATLGGVTLTASTATAAEKLRFLEETASAFWVVPHECADGSFVDATLLVQSTRDFESPEKEDAEQTARVQYQAVCPDGTSFSWIAFAPAGPVHPRGHREVTDHCHQGGRLTAGQQTPVVRPYCQPRSMTTKSSQVMPPNDDWLRSTPTQGSRMADDCSSFSADFDPELSPR